MGYRNAPDEPGRPSRGTRRARPHARALAREERGQSLVVIVIAMTLIVAVAALAIDASDWFATHHKAQVTADAAALAAANYMGTALAAGTAPATASAAGISTAESYASRNGLPISDGNVTIDTGGETVTVTVPTTGPLFFAGISLGSGPSISARATASWKIQDCTSAGSNCAFAYAADNVCSGNTGVTASIGNNKTAVIGHGITFDGNGASQSVIGDVVSASNLDTSTINKNNTWASVGAYSSGTNCTGPTPGTPSPPFTTVDQGYVKSKFPIDYRTIYGSCPSTSSLFNSVTCDTANYPSYCTPAYEGLASVTSISNGSIYCNAGTGNPSDPTTWNGVTSVAPVSKGTFDATFIAGQVTFSLPNGTTISPPPGDQLLAYAADCNDSTPSFPATCPASVTSGIQAPAITLATNANGSGGTTITGDLFAPAGLIDSNLGGTPTLTGFLEGWDIVYNVNGTVTGQGPPVNNQGYFVGDYLIQ